MARELATVTRLAPPTISEPEWLKRCLDALKADYLRPKIAESKAPSESQRSFILSEVAKLRKDIASIDIDTSAVAVSKLLFSFAMQNASKESQDARAEGYLTALEDIPTWAVLATCRAYLKGTVKGQNKAFGPTPPQFREAAQVEMGPVYWHLSRLEMLLRAEIKREYSDEHRKEMLSKMQALFSGLPQ